MRVLGVVLVSTLFLSFSNFQVKKVFICNSPQAKVYHFSKTCRGINSCTHDIKEITEADAKSLGRRICGFED